MRIAHCTVALAILASLAGTGRAETAPAGAPVDFTVFFRGTAIGVEQVTVTRTPQGIVISGTERIGPPISITTRRASIAYTADWRPLECVLEGSVRDQQVVLHTTVTGTTAANDATQGLSASRKSDQVAADALLLPNIFFGAYEALAARLPRTRPGDQVNAYVPPQAAVVITVKGVADDRVRTPAGVIQVRRYTLEIGPADRPAPIEVWTDPDGHLLRLTVTAQAFDVVRTDIASISSRLEPVSRPNDEQVQVPALGFSLAGTLSRPETKPGPAVRLPAVVLVSGSEPTDRDQSLAGIPVFGQLAGALADAGFIVLRYDKRGLGQSGGRAESTTLADYAEDAAAAVKFLRRRKDVDSSRVALLGYGEGGAIAAAATSREGSVAALVLVAAPGVTGAALGLEQQRHLLESMSISAEEKRAKIELQEKLQQAVVEGRGFDAIPEDLRRQADTPWFRSFLTFDPARVVRKLDQPILIVHGELDRQIAPSNADKLEAVAKARKGRAGLAVKAVKLPGINHLLVPATTGEVDEYDRLTDRNVSRDVAAAIIAWLNETMRAR